MESMPISSIYPNMVNIQNYIIVLSFVHEEAQTLILPLLSDGPNFGYMVKIDHISEISASVIWSFRLYGQF